MKFMSGLFGRKADGNAHTQRISGVDIDDVAPIAPLVKQKAMSLEDAFEDEDEDTLMSIDHVVGQTANAAPKPMNIWDLEEASEPEEPAVAQVKDARASARARRNRTRLIGFDKSDGDVVDLFDSSPVAEPAMDRVQFPVGWILVIDGPGRGFAFPLVAGMSQMGRGNDQTISLDFGDSAISRNNHAAIVYDAESREFLLGHGGKANIVRLNGKPVISNETLKNGDKIVLGETTLQLKALCGPDFDWSDDAGKDEEQDDVAIA